jgi:hypothetical protein
MATVLWRERRLPTLITDGKVQSIAAIVLGHLWLVAAFSLVGRGKSIGEAPFGLWAFCYGLPLPLTIWGIHRVRTLAALPKRPSLFGGFLLVYSLIAAAYPFLFLVLILYWSK